MTFIRRALATGALAAALTGSALAPATADTTDTTCDTASLQAAITEARATEVAARKAFVASNRPIGKLIATERKDAVAAKREALAELKALAKESRTLARAGKPAKAERADKPAAPVETSKKSDKGAAAAAIKAEIRAYQDQLREANKLLGSKKALVEQVKAERREAKVSWDAAKGDLRELRQQLEACEESAPVEEPVVEEPVTDPVDTEPVVEEPVVTEPVVEEPVTDAPVTEPTV